MAIETEGAHAAYRDNTRRWRFRERQAHVTIVSKHEVVTFKHPFLIRGIDRLLPAGDYEIVTDDEPIDGLSFAAFRRVATMIMVPAKDNGVINVVTKSAKDSRGLAMEMISISSADLADAQHIDASACDG